MTGNVRQTPEQLRQRCYDAHDGLYSYEEADFQTAKDKVKIRCPVHGLFEQQTIEHYKGRGCIKCSYNNSPVRVVGKKTKGTRVLDITGYRFGKDLQVEVLECVGTAKTSYEYKHLVKCHTCAQDPEMFGDAIYVMTRENIFGRNVPCGCAKGYIYNEEQFSILGNRFCEGKPISFVGVELAEHNRMTKLKFRCDIDGHEWNKPYSQLYQDCGCWKCGRVSTGAAHYVDDDTYNKTFLSSGKYENGTVFRRCPEDKNMWYMFCPTCSVNGQEFLSYESTFRRGFKACYCGVGGGYDRTKNGYFYVIRAISDTTEFTGYGITNVPTSRMSAHRTNLGKKGFAIVEMELFDMTGQQALDLERKVKREFPLDRQNISGFREEATYYYLYGDVVAYVEQYLEQSYSSLSNS